MNLGEEKPLEKEKRNQNTMEKRKKKKSEEHTKEDAKPQPNITTNNTKKNEDTKGDAKPPKPNTNPNKRKKHLAPYGNYRSYYGYRIGDMDEDPRLKVFQKEWFEDKDCLDIGCNDGSLTIQIAKKFQCRSILGVDIDSDRVNDARRNLLNTLKKFGKTHSDSSEFKMKDAKNGPESDVNGSSAAETRDTSSAHSPIKERDLSFIVSFQRENFVESGPPPPGKHYDTIICLSVTKWVHLNWGDEGVITLFSKIWRLLNPGGIFVLEPQPWRSYQSNRLTTEITAANYRKITFPPDFFQDMLLDKIGFRSVEDLTSGLSGSREGFNRPILVFRK